MIQILEIAILIIIRIIGSILTPIMVCIDHIFQCNHRWLLINFVGRLVPSNWRLVPSAWWLIPSSWWLVPFDWRLQFFSRTLVSIHHILLHLLILYHLLMIVYIVDHIPNWLLVIQLDLKYILHLLSTALHFWNQINRLIQMHPIVPDLNILLFLFFPSF